MKNHNYNEELAKITRTSFGWEDHGILTAFIHVDYDSSSMQGIGGYCLDDTRRDENGDVLRNHNFVPKRQGTAYGLEWIMGVLEAVGVNNWEDLPGKFVWVIKEGSRYGKICGLRGFRSDKPFLFEDLRKRYFEND